MLFKKVFSFLWPSGNYADYHEIAGRRALNLFFLMAGLTGLVMTAINLPILSDEPLVVTGGFFASLCSLLGPFYMYKAKSFKKAARIVCIAGGGVLVMIAFDNGHYLSSSLTLLPSLLVVTTLALGMRTGLVIVGVMAALYGAIYIFHHVNYEGPTPGIYATLNWTEVLIAHCLSLVLLIIGASIFQYEMMRATESLKAAHDKAKQASQAKSDFLANMSHEIRTPMNGVLGMAEVLKRTGLTENQSLYVDTINRSGNALLTIINDVLDFSKIEAGKLTITPRPANFKSAVVEVKTLLGVAAQQKKIELSLECGDDLPENVEIDIGRLRQILTNLVGNAIKFTDNGAVTIRLSAKVEGNDANWCLEVEDTGIGIAEEKLGLVFSQFEQAENSSKRAYSGTGLGLTISRRLVEAMGGKIGVRSQLGVGSVFWVQLKTPIVNDGGVAMKTLTGENKASTSVSEQTDLLGHLAQNQDQSYPNELSQGKEQTANQCVKVLVAEDNMVNRLVVKNLIDPNAFSLVFAENGREALDKFKQEQFDLVLMDISMPVMDGIEAANAIRSFENEAGKKHTPIIALTAHALSGDKERFLQENIDDYLTKPIKQELLTAMLNKWVSQGGAEMDVA